MDFSEVSQGQLAADKGGLTQIKTPVNPAVLWFMVAFYLCKICVNLWLMD
jgi:hypothetical protein